VGARVAKIVTTSEKQERRGNPAWAPGVSGNPKGRPLGARHKLQTNFLEALANDFAANGPQSISDLREKDPGKYLAIIASLCPKELNVNHSPLDGMTDAELFAAVDALHGWLAAQQDAAGNRGAGAQEQGALEPSGVH